MAGENLAGDGGGVDSSLVVLLAANVVALALAMYFRMGPLQLVLVYLTQGVIIGLANVARILNLRRFDSHMPDEVPDVDPDPAMTKWLYAIGFVITYHGLHWIILSSMVRDAEMHRGASADFGLGFWLCTLVFACTHAYSLWHNIRADCRATRNILTMMMMPYMRVIPMLVSPIMAMAAPGAASIIVFGLFKTVGDCLMHHVEHRLLRRGLPPVVG